MSVVVPFSMLGETFSRTSADILIYSLSWIYKRCCRGDAVIHLNKTSIEKQSKAIQVWLKTIDKLDGLQVRMHFFFWHLELYQYESESNSDLVLPGRICSRCRFVYQVYIC